MRGMRSSTSRSNAGQWGLDGTRIAVGGDSAGGTLAAVCAVLARDAGIPLALQLLFYPGTAAHQDTPSHKKYAEGPLLGEALITYFFDQYVNLPADRDDWRFAPLNADDVEGVAPAWIGLAEYDPVVDEGIAYADKLRAAGVPVDLEIYRGVIHEFVKMGRAIPEALQAHADAARALQRGLATMTEQLKKSDFRFFHRLRVRWAEVDMQKIVFNAHYLMYFDTAIADYWRAMALPYEEAMLALGGDLYVRKATVEFNASARVDELLDVGMKCMRMGNSSILFAGGLFRGDDLLVSCELVYVFADPATQTSKPVPPLLREILAGYEAGEPMRDVATGNWESLGEGASQGAARSLHRRAAHPQVNSNGTRHDAAAVHVVARNRLGQAIATGRLVPESPGVGRSGRMAVHRTLRGGGHGAAVLRALEAAAAARGDREVTLHAQRSAEAFYARLGYAPHGAPFEEAGIAHIEMRRKL